MHIPEYSLSLLIWILPILFFTVFFIVRKLLSPEKIIALLLATAIWGSVGILLDLCLASQFFVFPEKEILKVYIRNIPIEEFVFYITGFWFILFLYVFCDEWYLKKYNVPDVTYARFRARLKKKLFFNMNSIWWAAGLLVGGFIIKRIINPEGEIVPGYFYFLVIVAYIPMFLFSRVTKKFVNWQGYFFSLIVTILISIIWEVTLALPREYWGFQKTAMLGIFITPWAGLPIEEISVWICSTLAILFYEYVKICYFTKVPSVPGHKLLLKVGRDWRKENYSEAPSIVKLINKNMEIVT